MTAQACIYTTERMECSFMAFDTLTSCLLVYDCVFDHVSSKHPTHPSSPWRRHNPRCPSFPHPEGTGTRGQGWGWVPVRRCLDRNTCSLPDCTGGGAPYLAHILKAPEEVSLSSWFSVPCLVTMATVARGSHSC